MGGRGALTSRPQAIASLYEVLVMSNSLPRGAKAADRCFGITSTSKVWSRHKLVLPKQCC